VKKTTVVGIAGAFLIGVGALVFFVFGMGCSSSQFLLGICFGNGQGDIGALVFMVGIVLMGIGFVLFFAAYEYEYSQKWTWWRQESYG
jgi:hypothetical protein